MSTIDLNQPPPNHTYSVSVDPQETTGELRVRLFKDVVLFIVAIGFVLVIGALCIRTLLTDSTAEEKKWAMSVLTAAAGGLIGFLVRK